MTLRSVLLLLLAVLTQTFAFASPTKVACIGDSITFGSGIKDRKNKAYPAQLQALLGEDFEVKNYGVSAHTMLSKGDHPWIKHAAFKQALAFHPNVVIIKLGTNDVKPHNWKHQADLEADATKLIESFRSLPTKPRILLCSPVPALTHSKKKPRYGIAGDIISGQVKPRLMALAQKLGVEFVDLHHELNLAGDQLASQLPDQIHPNAVGAARIAKRLADQIHHPRIASIDLPAALKKRDIDTKPETFGNFKGVSFKLPGSGAACRIIAPRMTTTEQRWIWRARFWGHQPALDQALLNRGFYVAYCDVSNLYGSPAATDRWDAFYQLTQALGMNSKPVLEGMSRGGLIIFNWAKKNPTQVSAIYGDNPVCDIRSWPMKRQGPDWQRCKKVWNLEDNAVADFSGNPIDGLKPVADAKVPVFLVLGTKDDVVPLAENADILETNYLALGGKLTRWEKPNGKHHPHGLAPVYPLLDALLESTK